MAFERATTIVVVKYCDDPSGAADPAGPRCRPALFGLPALASRARIGCEGDDKATSRGTMRAPGGSER
jgi:hypothetical protein